MSNKITDFIISLCQLMYYSVSRIQEQLRRMYSSSEPQVSRMLAILSIDLVLGPEYIKDSIFSVGDKLGLNIRIMHVSMHRNALSV
jgi:hypothetical protein